MFMKGLLAFSLPCWISREWSQLSFSMHPKYDICPWGFSFMIQFDTVLLDFLIIMYFVFLTFSSIPTFLPVLSNCPSVVVALFWVYAKMTVSSSAYLMLLSTFPFLDMPCSWLSSASENSLSEYKLNNKGDSTHSCRTPC